MTPADAIFFGLTVALVGGACLAYFLDGGPWDF